MAQCLKIIQNVAFEFFELWHFPSIFVLLKLTCLVTPQTSDFQKLAKMDHFWVFLVTQNVSVARFARNVE